jgi:hypothetical protein
MGRPLLNNFKAEYFIETGTYRGESLERAILSGRFERFISIEVSPVNAEAARKKFAGCTDVKIYLGTSPDILDPLLMDDLLGSTVLFWLDAHYQAGPKTELDPKYGECPLLWELRTILAKPWATLPVILIDDARMFSEAYWQLDESGQFTRGHWPTISEINAMIGSRYNLFEENDIIYMVPNV